MQRPSDQPKRHAAMREAIERARASGREETVLFHLRADPAAAPPSPAETEHLAAALIQRVAGQGGCAPRQTTVFENLGAMAVRADADLLLRLLDQPEVQAASLNRPQPGPVEPIRPVRKSAPSRQGWVDLPD